MIEHGIEWDQKGTHEKHKSVSEFKRDKLIEEVKILTEQKEELEHKISAYKNAEEYAMVTAQKFEDEALKLPDPSPLMSAKKYRNDIVMPFINKLIKIVKNLARRCYRAEKAEEKSVEVIAKLTEEKERYKSKVWNLNLENSRLKVQLRDYDKIKDYLGIDKVEELLKTINATMRRNHKKRHTEHER